MKGKKILQKLSQLCWLVIFISTGRKGSSSFGKCHKEAQREKVTFEEKGLGFKWSIFCYYHRKGRSELWVLVNCSRNEGQEHFIQIVSRMSRHVIDRPEWVSFVGKCQLMKSSIKSMKTICDHIEGITCIKVAIGICLIRKIDKEIRLNLRDKQQRIILSQKDKPFSIL